MTGRVAAVTALAGWAAGCSFTTEFPEDRLPPSSEQDCADGLDEDQDGQTDCADNDCLGDPACAEDSAAECVDGLDNDRDERPDCEDPGCHGWGVCLDRAVLTPAPRCHQAPTVIVSTPWNNDGSWVFQGDHGPELADSRVVFPPEAWRFDRMYTFRPLVMGRRRGIFTQLHLSFFDVPPDQDVGFHFGFVSGPVEAPSLAQSPLLELDVGRSAILSEPVVRVQARLHGELFVPVDDHPMTFPLDEEITNLGFVSGADGFVLLGTDDGVADSTSDGLIAVSAQPLAEWETAAHGVLWSDGGARVEVGLMGLSLRKGTGVDPSCGERRNPVNSRRGFEQQPIAPAIAAAEHRRVLAFALFTPTELGTDWRIVTQTSRDDWVFSDHRDADVVVGPAMLSGPTLWKDPDTGWLLLWYADGQGAWRRTTASVVPPQWSAPMAVEGPAPHAVAAAPASGLLGWRADDLGNAIVILRSDDQGVTWVAGEQVLAPGELGAWDSGGVWAPDVSRVEGGYVMAYEGVDGLTGRSGLGVAVSEDGITWRKRPGEALLEPSPAGFDDGSVEGPALAVDEESGRLSVWYAGRAFRSESGASGIGLAEFGYGPGANGSK